MRFFRGILATIILGGSLFLANSIQVLTLALLPVSKRLFRRSNERICGLWNRLLAFTVLHITGAKIHFSGDAPVKGESAFFIANHQCMADIPVIVTYVARMEMLDFLKWFVKDILKWVPGFGWAMWFLDSIFLKRNWNRDSASVALTFDRIRRYGARFICISFVEGTRATPEKKERSRGFARQKGLPVLEHVMVPRTKGFTATLEGLGSDLTAVYDLTLKFRGSPPGLYRFFFGPRPEIWVHVKRWPRELLPSKESEQAAWLVDRFREKDTLFPKLGQ